MGAGAYWFVVHCSGHRGADRARSPRWRYRVAPAPVVRQKHGAALVPEPALNPRGVAVRGFWMLLALVVAFPAVAGRDAPADYRSEEHKSELQSLIRNSYSVFCLKKKKKIKDEKSENMGQKKFRRKLTKNEDINYNIEKEQKHINIKAYRHDD